jgi:hypothetical protein
MPESRTKKYWESRLEALSQGGKKLYLITVPRITENTDQPKEDCVGVVLRKPSRHELDAVSGDIAAGRIMQAAEVLMRACAIEYDPELLTDDEYFIPAARVIGGLIEYQTADLKKS